jgi:ribosomal protein L11 methyltransferase
MATDIEPFSVRVAQQNVTQNRLGRLVKVRLADGWQSLPVRACGPYDLVLANVLARPLCLMARRLALHLVPGGTAIVSGLLRTHVRGVLAAHRRHGLRLETALYEDPWTTLVLRR